MNDVFNALKIKFFSNYHSRFLIVEDLYLKINYLYMVINFINDQIPIQKIFHVIYLQFMFYTHFVYVFFHLIMMFLYFLTLLLELMLFEN